MRNPYMPLPRKSGHQFDAYGQPADPSPVFLYSDFSGTALGAEWAIVELSDEEETTLEPGGYFKISIGETGLTQPENGALDHGNIRTIDLNQGVLFETRVRIAVAPTASEICWGLGSNHAANKDAMGTSAWFRLQNSMALLVESDDTSNNNDDVATGTTLVLNEWHTYGIDFRYLTDVKFFFDGARKGMGTTFNMTNLSSTAALVQPYFSVSKGSNNSTAEINIDYVKIWHERGA